MEGGAGWTDFLVAAAGASGALVGLVFVALSINLGRILAMPGVSGRAAETVLLLANVLLATLLALIPGLPQQQLGLVFLALWLPTWGVSTAVQLQGLRRRQYHRLPLALLRFVLYQLASVPLLLAALSLRGCFQGGLYWLALGLILSLMVALFNAWVLLVEILR
jgi:hypothetical protein